MRACLVGTMLAVAVAACGDDETGSGGAGAGGDAATGATTGTTSASSGGTTTSGGSGGEGTGGAGTGGEGTGGAGAGGSEAVEVSLRFAAQVGDEAAACATDYDLGVDGGVTQFEDIRFYVHDVRLVTHGGEEVPVTLEQDGLWQVENVALLDFEDGTGACVGNDALNDVVVGTAPAGDYMGLKYRLGVPVELNHQDVTSSPTPLDATDLFWGWGFGHIFLSVMTSSTPDGAKAPNEHFVHVGSVGCTGDPEEGEEVTCTVPNRPEIAFDVFDVATDVVVLDAAVLLAESNLGTDIGCHSFPETPACVAPFETLGLDYTTGEETPETQTAFRAEAQ